MLPIVALRSIRPTFRDKRVVTVLHLATIARTSCHERSDLQSEFAAPMKRRQVIKEMANRRFD
jgi:hypothetical protein